MLLMSIGDMRRLAGDCDAAVKAYEQYLQSNPPPAARADAEAAINGCEASAGKPKPAVAPPPPVPTTKPTPGKPAKPKRPWYRDPAGGVLVGVGTPLFATGIAIAALAGVTDHRARTAHVHGDFLDLGAKARLETRVAVSLASIGAAMIIAGAIRYGVLRAREKRAAKARADIAARTDRDRCQRPLACL